MKRFLCFITILLMVLGLFITSCGTPTTSTTTTTVESTKTDSTKKIDTTNGQTEVSTGDTVKK